MKLIKTLILVGLISLVYAGSAFAQANGSIIGSITDAAGAVIPGATVTAVAADGKQKQVVANARGEYTITGLPPGKYTLKAIAPNFGLYQNAEVVVTSGTKTDQIVVLTVEDIKATVDVNNANQISTDADANKDATIISGKDLDALPDDPDEMQAALLALVGGAAGPNGGQIYIDGFTGGQLPSKESIREIRINSNPFSAEYDRPGNGRIEILTKPGSDKWRGGFNGNFNDARLNSRNPFALNRAPTQRRAFGGNISGPIKKGKSSFSLEANNRDEDNNSIINAQILDPSFNIIAFRQDVRLPSKRVSIAPRLDFTINSKNTLVARYSFTHSSANNQGIGDTSLLSRAYNTASREHEIRLTETMIINPKTVNETRFEYSNNDREQTGDNSIPIISVSSSFTGGGASIGHSFVHNKTWELNNFTSTSLGKKMNHSFKVGGKLRHVSVDDRSENNYAGNFSFQGFALPTGTTDACDLNSDQVISSIEQFRCKVTTGLARYNPQQFNLTAGNPLVGVTQYDGALFVSDDWKYRPDLLISVGMRYEDQTNIHSSLNFAPRLGIAWSPGAGGAKQPKFVFRGGAGIFYNRFGENSTLQTLRFNGINQLSLLVNSNDADPIRRANALTLLSQPVFTATGVTSVPTATQIQALLPAAQSNSLTVVSPIFQAPYTMQAVFSVERALSSKFTLTTTYVASRTLHALRTRNINAPVCLSLTNCTGAVRPQPTLGNINAYESGGIVNQNRLNVFLRANINQKVSLFINYGLGFLSGNVGTPAYAYDLSSEYARSQGNSRHNFGVFGNVNLPWGISVSPNISFNSSQPFNITRGGSDFNGDGSFAERPTFAELQTRCNELSLKNSFCDVSGHDLLSIIPRNYGVGPHSFNVNTSIRKNFGFGKTAASKVAANGSKDGTPRGGENRGAGGNRGGGGGGAPQMIMMSGPGGGGGGGAVRMGGGGGFGGGDVRKPYNLSVGVEIQNLFNIVNLASPVGSLTSSRFGQSTSTGGGFGPFGGGGGGPNRRISLNMRFNW